MDLKNKILSKEAKIGVIGLGYIGLPTATLFARNGLNVAGVDVNRGIVEKVNRGEVHIVEPDLGSQLSEAVAGGRLTASTKVAASDAFIIAVPTPFKGDHIPDISYVEAAVRSIAPVLTKGALVILESTSPVGTTENIAQLIDQLRPDLKFSGTDSGHVHFAYCPERVLPGKTMKELVENDRIIGGMQECCSEAARSLYKTFVKGECLITDSKTAEMCKLAENAFRDVNIAFANELSIICDKLGIDVWELIRLANHHPRVNILNPGPGVGGHCIAVDPWFIVDSAPQEAQMIGLARKINDSKPGWVIGKVMTAIDGVRNSAGNGRLPSVACLGLSFKANIDDLRESPALEIVQLLASMNSCNITCVEPHVSDLPLSLRNYGNVKLTSLDDALGAADVVIGFVDHDVFKRIDVESLAGKVVIDTRGIWSAQRLEAVDPTPTQNQIIRSVEPKLL